MITVLAIIGVLILGLNAIAWLLIWGIASIKEYLNDKQQAKR